MSTSLVRTILLLSLLLSDVLVERAAGDVGGDSGLPTVISSLEEAAALAKEDGRLVMVEIKAWHCGHCRSFEAKVLRSEEFRAFASESLHLVRYDIARRSELSEVQRKELDTLMKAHTVKLTPTILVFSPKGDILLRTEGYEGSPATRIVEHLRGLLNGIE